MKPPTGGPTSGPISAGMVSQAMAETSSRFGVARTSTSRATGVIIAPPMPCRKRASTKSTSEPENAQAIEPMTKTPIADAEDALGAEAVGHPAADRDEDGERDEIGGQRQLERDRAGADIVGDRRQRGRDDGRIHVLHEQGDREDERDGSVQGAVSGDIGSKPDRRRSWLRALAWPVRPVCLILSAKSLMSLAGRGSVAIRCAGARGWPACNARRFSSPPDVVPARANPERDIFESARSNGLRACFRI